MEKETLVLEPSTNTHSLHAKRVSGERIDSSTISIDVSEDNYLKHGEHGSFRIESPNALKYNQKEYNPVTKAIQNAFD